MEENEKKYPRNKNEGNLRINLMPMPPKFNEKNVWKHIENVNEDEFFKLTMTQYQKEKNKLDMEKKEEVLQKEIKSLYNFQDNFKFARMITSPFEFFMLLMFFKYTLFLYTIPMTFTHFILKFYSFNRFKESYKIQKEYNRMDDLYVNNKIPHEKEPFIEPDFNQSGTFYFNYGHLISMEGGYKGLWEMDNTYWKMWFDSSIYINDGKIDKTTYSSLERKNRLNTVFTDCFSELNYRNTETNTIHTISKYQIILEHHFKHRKYKYFRNHFLYPYLFYHLVNDSSRHSKLEQRNKFKKFTRYRKNDEATNENYHTNDYLITPIANLFTYNEFYSEENYDYLLKDILGEQMEYMYEDFYTNPYEIEAERFKPILEVLKDILDIDEKYNGDPVTKTMLRSSFEYEEHMITLLDELEGTMVFLREFHNIHKDSDEDFESVLNANIVLIEEQILNNLSFIKSVNDLDYTDEEFKIRLHHFDLKNENLKKLLDATLISTKDKIIEMKKNKTKEDLELIDLDKEEEYDEKLGLDMVDSIEKKKEIIKIEPMEKVDLIENELKKED